MDLIDNLMQIASRVEKQIEAISTEEATKNALVMPVINALGYNVFDPTEVIPEFTADHGVKKGEKVDYAIIKDGKPMILIECKSAGSTLNLKCTSQLFRYFSVTDARFAILTNGIQYLFFTDIESPNKMDEKPFFEFNILELDDRIIRQLKKFSKSNFELEDILSNASELKYVREIRNLIEKEFEDPSEEIVRLFATQVIQGKFMGAVKTQFKGIVSNAFREFIKDRVNDRIKSALDSGSTQMIEEEMDPAEARALKIDTTEEETEAFHIVKAILAKDFDPKRIVMRDTQSYCGVLMDDNNRKPICRLHFNASQKYIGLFDEEKNETREPIQDLNEIYQYSEKLIETAERY